MDQAVLRDDGLTVYEITAGCICCQLGVDLVKTLELLVEQERPQTVIVEASGVATPDGVLDALSYYHGPAFASTRSVGVLDPTRLEALLDVMTPLIESQVADVDELVITKVDEATEQELEVARRAVERLQERMRPCAGSPLWMRPLCKRSPERCSHPESRSDRAGRVGAIRGLDPTYCASRDPITVGTRGGSARGHRTAL